MPNYSFVAMSYQRMWNEHFISWYRVRRFIFLQNVKNAAFVVWSHCQKGFLLNVEALDNMERGAWQRRRRRRRRRGGDGDGDDGNDDGDDGDDDDEEEK